MNIQSSFIKKLNTILNVINDLTIILVSVLIVGLNSRPYTKLKKGVCSALTTIILIGYGKVLECSWLGAGIKYSIYSIAKHMSILYAREAGWNHQLVESFKMFSSQKDKLIQVSTFASFLNWLASRRTIAKIIQIVLLAICLAIAFVFILALCQSIENLLEAILRPAVKGEKNKKKKKRKKGIKDTKTSRD